MSEEEPKRRRWEVAEGLSVAEHHLGRVMGLIPSDDGSFCLQALHGYDLWLSMINPEDGFSIPLNGIRFRTQMGGGSFPFIYDEFSVLSRAFIDHQGQVPQGYEGQLKEMQKHASEYQIKIGVLRDNFPSHAGVTIETSKKKNEPKIKISNIPCDDEGKQSQVDIEVAQNGDVALRMRGTNRISFYEHEDPKEGDYKRGQMTFKTAENGGRYPIMAFIFTKIAERMLKAKKEAERRRR